jgi:hypothetical protein
MFGSSTAHAGSALLIALIRKLTKNGTLTQDEATDVLNDAISALRPLGHVVSIASAISMTETNVRTRISVQNTNYFHKE